MLENKKFVAWANENAIVLVGHTDKGHPDVVADAKGEEAPGCPLYPGMTCAQHQAITGECVNASDELPRVPVGNTRPQSFLISPEGTVEVLEGAAQASSSKIQEMAEEMQKAVGKPVTWKKYSKMQELIAEGDEALAEDEFKTAFGAYRKVEKDRKKLTEALKVRIDERLDALGAKAALALQALKDGETPVKQRLKDAARLKSAIGLSLKRGGKLDVVAEIETWISEQKAALKAAE